MNCDDFMERVQNRLDDRLSITDDVVLQRHAERCDVCRGQLFAWQQISRVLPASRDKPSLQHRVFHFVGRLAVSVAMVAASLAFAIFVFTHQPPPVNTLSSTTVPKSAPHTVTSNLIATTLPISGGPTRSAEQGRIQRMNEIHPSIHEKAQTLDTQHWLNVVHDRQWVKKTMPTVQSLRDGVAPLGRTLLRAVSILTTSRHGAAT